MGRARELTLSLPPEVTNLAPDDCAPRPSTRRSTMSRSPRSPWRFPSGAGPTDAGGTRLFWWTWRGTRTRGDRRGHGLLSRTVGWFTSGLYPRPRRPGPSGVGRGRRRRTAARAGPETGQGTGARPLPDRGIGYGLLRQFLNPETGLKLAGLAAPQTRIQLTSAGSRGGRPAVLPSAARDGPWPPRRAC
ncbi:hypothetical protein LV779_36160 [Streptomyces thinghirensis]|nr:hypothetical protein [Streptomyces thinghirensis]